MTDPGVRLFATLSLDLGFTCVPKSKREIRVTMEVYTKIYKKNSYSYTSCVNGPLTNYTFCVLSYFKFGDTEIRATAVDVVSGNIIKATFDFLDEKPQ